MEVKMLPVEELSYWVSMLWEEYADGVIGETVLRLGLNIGRDEACE